MSLTTDGTCDVHALTHTQKHGCIDASIVTCAIKKSINIVEVEERSDKSDAKYMEKERGRDFYTTFTTLLFKDKL